MHFRPRNFAHLLWRQIIQCVGPKKISPALKHGGYSTLRLLPGEDPAAVEKLHKTLVAEFPPNGALEEDIVLTIAHLTWRKQSLGTFHLAELAWERRNAIKEEIGPRSIITPRKKHNDT